MFHNWSNWTVKVKLDVITYLLLHTPLHHSMQSKCDELCEGVRVVMGEVCERWRVELESGGNIKFVPGDPSLPWYKCCLDLMGSRFTVSDVKVCVGKAPSTTHLHPSHPPTLTAPIHQRSPSDWHSESREPTAEQPV